MAPRGLIPESFSRLQNALRSEVQEIDGVRPSFMERFFAKYETWSSFSGAVRLALTEQ